MVDTTPAQPAEQKERLPLPPRIARFVVLFAVFVCAACGLVYELALVALGSYLLGDTITQASVVLAVMVFAMGVGSLASKQLTHRPAFWFAVVEGLLSLLGGLSVLILYAAFAWFSLYQRPRQPVLPHRCPHRRGNPAADDPHPAHTPSRGRQCGR